MQTFVLIGGVGRSGTNLLRRIRYEDLTADPVGTTQRVCAFVGVAFEARMLTKSDYALRGDNSSFEQADGDRHPVYAGIRRPPTRKDHLTAAEQDLVAGHCGELAEALGYEKDGDW